METPAPEEQRDKERAWREWMLVAVGLIGLLSVLSTIVAVVALASTNTSPGTTVTVAAAPTTRPAATQAATPAPQALKLLVKADSEHGRLGPDKQWHDAFLPADFSVHAGATVTVTIYNYDSGPHTFTSPSLGINEIIPGGGAVGAPKEVTFTFTAPKSGKYQWWCSVPCDPWAMAHDGYMRGVVNVTA